MPAAASLAGCTVMSASCPDDEAASSYVVIVGPDGGTTDGGATDGGASNDCLTMCGLDSGGSRPLGCEPMADGTGNVRCTYPAYCEGRRPAGLADDASLSAGRDVAEGCLGRHFAMMAYYEAASVPAFQVLERELALYGAPVDLRRRARRALRDEVRHARMAGALARRFGSAVLRPHVSGVRTRPLVEVAVENAREGCVRETYGALVASWQAAFASDRSIRRVMATIARDEARHAALGWAVARFLASRLGAAERGRVVRERRAAFAELTREARRDPPDGLVQAAGLPRATQAAALASRLADALSAA
jgi:hypothetical protein